MCIRDSSKEGIFLAGFCQGPMDIPETVADASGVASQVATLLNSFKFTETKEKIIGIPEKIVKETDITRIGVIICHCGINIGKYIDIPQVIEHIKTLPNVVFCEDNLYSCSSDSQERIKEVIGEYNLNRFIVASCTPRTHESLFQETCQEAGLNKYLFEMVNIRDQCSWVHMTEKELATEKAIDLIRMGVAKSRLLKSQEEKKLKITQTAMVIGGGISGMTAALNIANQGFIVYLIEKEKYLGGNLRYLNMLYPTQEDASVLLNETIEKVEQNKNIQIFSNCDLKDINGFLGNYNVSLIDSDKEIHELKIGTIIVATGGQELKPNEFFEYKYTNHNVITQLQLEQKLKDEDNSWLDKLNHITTLLCVNARQEKGITYCSNICCESAIKNINILKELKQDLKLIVLYRDLQMAKKEFERYYRERRKDAIFLRYDLDDPPVIKERNSGTSKFEIKVFDTNLQDNIKFDTDLIVLSTPMIPADNLDELAKMLKVPIDKNGFFLEAHVKLRPLDFATEGIFLCGCAQWPKNIQDSISQGNGAAGRACRFLSAEEITTSGLIAEVDADLCIGCGTCEEACSYNAIEITNVLKEFEDVSLPIRKSSVNSSLCKGCGTCAVNCPVGAISIKHYDFEQINAMIRTLAT